VSIYSTKDVVSPLVQKLRGTCPTTPLKLGPWFDSISKYLILYLNKVVGLTTLSVT